MKRQSLVLLAVAAVAAGAAGCFKDPVSSLRNGPTAFSLDHNAVFIAAGDSASNGDSTTVTAYLEDGGGNQLPVTGATWTSANPTVAVVRNDTTLPIPGSAFTRGVIRAVAVDGGGTNVVVSARGVSDTIRVVVLPTHLAAAHVAVAGTVMADTVIVPPSAVSGTPVKHIAYTAGDTLVLRGTSLLKFDPAKVTVTVSTSNGAADGFLVYESADSVKAVFAAPAPGKVLVQHLLFTPGSAAVGTIPIDSLFTDSVAVASWHLDGVFGGSASVTGDTLTVNAGTGMTFANSSVVTMSSATDTMPAVPCYTLSGTTTQLTVLCGGTVSNARVTVSNVTMTASGNPASITFGSLKTNTQAYAIAQATLPAAMVSQAGDTITITATAPVTFDTAQGTKKKPNLNRSGVTFGGTGAVILARTPTTFSYVLSPTDYTGPITVTNALVGTTIIPELPTAGSYTLHALALPAADVIQTGDTLRVVVAPPLALDTVSGSGAMFGGNNAVIIGQTAASMNYVLSPAAYTGPLTLTNVLLHGVNVAALSTAGSYTLQAFALASGDVDLGGAKLGDTVTITAPNGLQFTGNSAVLLGNRDIETSDTAWMLSNTPSVLRVFAKRGGTGQVTVTNVQLGASVDTAPTLSTVGAMTIDSFATVMPVGIAQSQAVPITLPASGPMVFYGTQYPATLYGGFSQSYYTFTTTTPDSLTGSVAWFGSGCPYGAGNCYGSNEDDPAYTEDIDFTLCDANTVCDESGSALASSTSVIMPEHWKTATTLPAGQYWLGILSFNVSYSIVYQVTLNVF